jgi:hypothetical protein
MRKAGVVAGVVLASLMMAGGSQAKMITVGPTFPMPVENTDFIRCGPCTLTNLGPTIGGADVSPVDGVILHWHLYRALESADYRLRVLSPQGYRYVGAGSSEPEMYLDSRSVEEFSTHLPIKAGQLIGLEIPDREGGLFFGEADGSDPLFFAPTVADGEEAFPDLRWSEGQLANVVFPFNAEILPVPTIAAVSTGQGPAVGGGAVTITGENFAELTSVSFGSAEATYVVESETRLTATVPAGTPGSSVPISIVTAAGKGEAAAPYSYEASPQDGGPDTSVGPSPPTCLVPRLKGKPLAAVRQTLKRDECRLGRLRKNHKVTARTGRVKGQIPPPGTALPAGGKVTVTLGPRG